MARSGRVKIFIDADASNMERGVSRASGSLKHLESSSKRTHKAMGTLGSSLKRTAGYAIGAATAYVGIAQAKAAVTTTEDLAKTTLSLHKNLGLTVKSASEWAAVAKARGVDGKALAQSFGILSKNVEAAKVGTASAVKPFRDLGISQAELRKTSPQDLMLKVADGMKKLGPGTTKTADAMKLFGKGWQTINPLLRDGSKALQDQLATANKYGATFGGKSLKSVEDLIGAQRELKLAGMGLQMAFTHLLAPALLKVGLGVAGFVNQLRKAKDLNAALKIVGDDVGHMLDKAVPVLTKAATTLGPKVAGALVKGFLNAPGLAKLAAGLWLFKRLGGFSAFRQAGVQSATTMTNAMGQTVAKSGGKFKTGLRGMLGGAAGMAKGLGAAVVGTALISGIASAISSPGKVSGFDAGIRNFASGFSMGLVKNQGQVEQGAIAMLSGATKKAAAQGLFMGRQTALNFNRSLRDFVGLEVKFGHLSAAEGKAVLDAGKAGAAAGRSFNRGLALMRAGTISTMGDVNKTVANGSAYIAANLGEKSNLGRLAMARNFASAAQAVAAGMKAGTISVKAGMSRIHELMKNARLFAGADPTGFARGMVSTFKRAGKVTTKGVHGVVTDLAKMPPAARRTAAKTAVNLVRELEKGHKIAKGSTAKLVSALSTRWTAMATSAGKHGKRTKELIINALTGARDKGVAAGKSLKDKLLSTFAGVVSGTKTKMSQARDKVNPFLSILHTLAGVHINLGAMFSGSISGTMSGFLGTLGSAYKALHRLHILAAGTKTTGPMLALIGEAGREYVIPVTGRHQERGRELVTQAAKDLGMSVMADGGSSGDPQRVAAFAGLPAFAGGATISAKAYKTPKTTTIRSIMGTDLHGRAIPRYFPGTKGPKGKNGWNWYPKPEEQLLSAYSLAQLTKTGDAATLDGLTYGPVGTADDLAAAGKLLNFYKALARWSSVGHWIGRAKHWEGHRAYWAGRGANRHKVPSTRHLVKSTRKVLWDYAGYHTALDNVANWQSTIAGIFSGESTDTPIDNTALIEALQEKLRSTTAAYLVSQAQYPVLGSFAGSFAEGGRIPAGKWGIAGERGREIISGPATVTPVGAPNVEVHLHGSLAAIDPQVEVVVDGKLAKLGRSAGLARQTVMAPGRKATLGQRRRRNVLGRR